MPKPKAAAAAPEDQDARSTTSYVGWTDFFYRDVDHSGAINFTASMKGGTKCPDIDPPSVTTEFSTNFDPTDNPRPVFCPMSHQSPTLTDCCFREGLWHCCSPHNSGSNASSEQSSNSSVKWVVGVSAVLCCCLIGVIVVATFNKCTKLFWRSTPDSNQRPKLHLHKRRHEILPVDKRVVLKTDNYIVEQSWDAITIRFYSRDFYDSFKDSLIGMYPALSSWKDARRRQEARVTDFSGLEVTLVVNDDLRSLLVTEDGALSWVMGDFQTVCKNIKLSGIPELPQAPAGHCLPRQATIGEEFFDAGEYNVKLSKTQIEIKFASEGLFESVKRTLLGRYPSVPWSKYLQRDCAQIQLDSGRTVTLHLWEDIRSIWVSGDGKKEWYGKEFHEIHSVSSLQGHSASFTVKMLHMGGYEIEFSTPYFLPKIKSILEDRYPSAVWHKANCREETSLPVSRSRNKTRLVLVQMGNAKIKERKIWINGEAEILRQWLEELNEICLSITDSTRDHMTSLQDTAPKQQHATG